MAANDRLLAAFSREISPFLDDDTCRSIHTTSRLLSAAYQRHVCRPDRVWRVRQLALFRQHQDRLVQDLRAVLHHPQATASSTTRGNGRKAKNRSVRLRDDQLLALVRDLVLVGLDVRASCLVDTCQLDADQVDAMLTAFSAHEAWRVYGLQHLTAVLLGGNVFFVHTAEFVRVKCLDIVANLQNVVLVNASAHLQSPQLIANMTGDMEGTRRGLVASVTLLVDRLLSQHRRLDYRRISFDASTVCATALAGLILCYPVVYHVGAAHDAPDHDPFWSTSDNCLGHCPLHLFQTSVILVERNTTTATATTDAERFVLQEFSLPQQLYQADDLSTAHAPPPEIIIRHCTRSLERAVGGTGLLSIKVESSVRTLAHVAL